ncbi:MAG: hypothetical protein K2Y26_02950 [Gemmatimonadaceae bacterium]|nr:hypothetical protein [Gemmatimonadaceae bacterium]
MPVFSPDFVPPPLTDRPLVSDVPDDESVEYTPSFDAWFEASRAYWEAGQALMARAQARSATSARFLPAALFVVRHSVELHLKSIILDSESALGAPLSDNERKLFHGHSLTSLWQLLQRRLERLGARDQSPRWARTAALVEQLGRLDHSSFEFRYPETKSGTATSSTSGIRINLVQFTEVLAELHFMLHATSAWIAELPGKDV